jgi:hypothetical protein|tara:strand:+ start:307 stop:1062 length:756 start_codon:yes stop_codon:yes gene_type:complete
MLSGIPFYNQTTKKAVAVFGTIFNNIYTTKPGKAKERVPIAYGPAQKFITRLNDAGSDTDRISLKVPRMSFEITSISLDAERSLNKMNKHVYSEGGKSVFQGVPYTIGFTLTIIGKDQDSCLQIVEQILPTFRPDYTLTIKDMERPGMSADVPVILTSVAPDDSYEGDYTTSRVLTYTLEFEMKIKYFGQVSTSTIIRTVETYMHTSPNNSSVATNYSPLDGVRITTGASDSPASFTATTTFGFTDKPIPS